MHYLPDRNMHTETPSSNNSDRVGARVPYVDSPWLPMRIDRRRLFRKLNYLRGVRQLHRSAAKLILNEVLIWAQMNHGPVLQRAHLARQKCQTDKSCFDQMCSSPFSGSVVLFLIQDGGRARPKLRIGQQKPDFSALCKRAEKSYSSSCNPLNYPIGIPVRDVSIDPKDAELQEYRGHEFSSSTGTNSAFTGLNECPRMVR
jgi:hypothetical protein